MKTIRLISRCAKAGLLLAAIGTALATSALTIPNVPLTVQQSVKPLVMLVAGKDHRFFYEAYNDAGDVDGDGTLDVRFKPSITYLGLFQPNLCYTHNGDDDNTGLFSPSSLAGTLNTCSGSSEWSGNWLNYVTTSRIDALRVVLYGGYREVDGTGTTNSTGTVLRRAYIPQDAHSWAKEYTSEAVDKYKISDYTPLDQPNTNRRHFFGNLTANAGTNCATLNNCSNLPPWLSYVTNSNKRVWEWASTERPVLSDSTHGGTRANRTVRVRVCTTTFHDGCKQYPNGRYKPVGLLHDYGESDNMLFGLITGSYDKSMSGGRLRKVVSSFTSEVDANTGQFTSSDTIVGTFDKLRIRDYNNGRTDQVYRLGFPSPPPGASNGAFPDWGNPIAEMMYEAVRYFAGKAAATTAYAGTSTVDGEVGLGTVTWDDPYNTTTSAAKAPFCARANMLVISDINVSYDSNELPGSAFATFTGDVTGLNVQTEATTITANEPTVPGLRFIGESDGVYDAAPSAKTVTNLGKIRGIAPEEPTKQGSYYASSVSYFAKKTDLRADKQNKQTVDTFVVAMASPLPRIEAKLPNGKVITMVPFAKSVSGFGISSNKGDYQPTNQIVDFYVETIANSGAGDADATVNGGRYFAKFRINYEDVEHGADHDMDAIVEYTVEATSTGKLKITVVPIYQAGSVNHRMGYILSGTSNVAGNMDGVYLVVQDTPETNNGQDNGTNNSTPYFLNTPPGRDPGYCDKATMPADCKRLPWLPYAGDGVGDSGPQSYSVSVREFTPATSTSVSAATILKDPLWYAAKWGGFVDKNGNDKPDLAGEWDGDGNGTPDTYLLVQNPLKLKESLKKTLDTIASRSSSASNISANSTSISSSSRLYQAVFNTQRWSGDLIAYPALATGVGSTPAWEASTALPAWNARNVFLRTSASTTVKLTTRGALSTSDQADFVSTDVFEYLLGNRTRELQNGGGLRDREHGLGDIVHSSPFYEKENNVVYVGGNDGMLHAFAGADGKELFGFIPRQSVSRLKNLASLNYAHDYYVDGDVHVTLRSTLTNDKNYLFGLLGRGGKGLFALDVTNPTTFAATNFLWEYTPAGDPVTAGADADLGYMLGRVTSFKLNNGLVGVFAGNGYNSTNGRAVLYIFILNANGSISSIKKLDTGVAGDNGLAAPAILDADGDGDADYVYAGDLKGNVWKFDISASTPSGWNVALSGNPLFVAKDPGGTVQPITAPMSIAINDKTGDPNIGKRFVFFGTGSYFKSGDAADTQVQTWYGIMDENTTVSGRGALRERDVSATGTVGGSTVRTFSAAATNDMNGRKGWYLDLDAPQAGERMVTTSRIVQFAVPALMASSLYPVPADPCVPGGNGYLNLIDPFTGGALTTGVIDLNLDGDFSNDTLGTSPIGSVDLAIGIPTEPLTMNAPGGKLNIYIGGSGSSSTSGSLIKFISGKGPGTPPCTVNCPPGGGPTGAMRGRLSWREIVRD